MLFKPREFKNDYELNIKVEGGGWGVNRWKVGSFQSYPTTPLQ